ncbi:MAG: SDR family oxidoreductase [Deltaproteobacteria bacterium]|nr:SDR family oxidoreductase [Deltaproteobacteria bacterium]
MTWNLNLPYCDDLPTKPNPKLGKVLVTGASGYVGGRLVSELTERGYDVRVMVRVNSPEHKDRWPKSEIVVADAFSLSSLKRALEGISVAYYLIHSLLLGCKEFENADTKAASNFREAAEFNNIKRIIYLGGLGDIRTELSDHLKSRIMVSDEFSRSSIPVTVLRAAVIVGSGSASFEIVKDLVKNIPVFFVPKWARTKCQPISIRDTIKYLVGVLEIEKTSGESFDIGGSKRLSYKEMMKVFAAILNKKVLFINVFFSNYNFFSYMANLFTPVPAKLIKVLFESGGSEVVCKNSKIKEYLNFTPLSYSEAIVFALDREDQDRIRTTWSDAYPPAHDLAVKLTEVYPTYYNSSYSLVTKKSESAIYNSFCKIGGKDGWFHSNWIWRLRGLLDTLLMGVGSARKRRSKSTLRINDVIGFWRIEDLKQNKRLLLRAEMILPGKGWLEFLVANKKGENKLSVTAYFQHKNFFGRVYWYTFLPFHIFIFEGLIKQIERRS